MAQHKKDFSFELLDNGVRLTKHGCYSLETDLHKRKAGFVFEVKDFFFAHKLFGNHQTTLGEKARVLAVLNARLFAAAVFTDHAAVLAFLLYSWEQTVFELKLAVLPDNNFVHSDKVHKRALVLSVFPDRNKSCGLKAAPVCIAIELVPFDKKQTCFELEHVFVTDASSEKLRALCWEVVSAKRLVVELEECFYREVADSQETELCKHTTRELSQRMDTFGISFRLVKGSNLVQLANKDGSFSVPLVGFEESLFVKDLCGLDGLAKRTFDKKLNTEIAKFYYKHFFFANSFLFGEIAVEENNAQIRLTSLANEKKVVVNSDSFAKTDFAENPDSVPAAVLKTEVLAKVVEEWTEELFEKASAVLSEFPCKWTFDKQRGTVRCRKALPELCNKCLLRKGVGLDSWLAEGEASEEFNLQTLVKDGERVLELKRKVEKTERLVRQLNLLSPADVQSFNLEAVVLEKAALKLLVRLDKKVVLIDNIVFRVTEYHSELSAICEASKQIQKVHRLLEERLDTKGRASFVELCLQTAVVGNEGRQSDALTYLVTELGHANVCFFGFCLARFELCTRSEEKIESSWFPELPAFLSEDRPTRTFSPKEFAAELAERLFDVLAALLYWQYKGKEKAGCKLLYKNNLFSWTENSSAAASYFKAFNERRHFEWLYKLFVFALCAKNPLQIIKVLQMDCEENVSVTEVGEKDGGLAVGLLVGNTLLRVFYNFATMKLSMENADEKKRLVTNKINKYLADGSYKEKAIKDSDIVPVILKQLVKINW